MNIQAQIQLVDSVTKHHNADTLYIVQIGGYQVITNQTFQVGEKAILVYPDSALIGDDIKAKYPKISRVKAIKLRGEYSFGLILKLSDYNVLTEESVGSDVSDIVGVKKYESTENIPYSLDIKSGQCPIPKTDEENVYRVKKDKLVPFGDIVDVTLKIDGQSMSVFAKKEADGSWTTGITSRSCLLDENCINKYTINAKNNRLIEKLLAFCQKEDVSLAIRGESYGLGIQNSNNNPHCKLPLSFAAFSVYEIGHGYAEKGSKYYYQNVCSELQIPQVPILEKDVILTEELIKKYSDDLTKIDYEPFEGVVIKHSKGSFKIINKDYDSKK